MYLTHLHWLILINNDGAYIYKNFTNQNKLNISNLALNMCIWTHTSRLLHYLRDISEKILFNYYFLNMRKFFKRDLYCGTEEYFQPEIKINCN